MEANLDMLIHDLEGIRSRLVTLETYLEKCGDRTFEMGGVAAHVTTALDSVSAAKSCAIEAKLVMACRKTAEDLRTMDPRT